MTPNFQLQSVLFFFMILLFRRSTCSFVTSKSHHERTIADPPYQNISIGLSYECFSGRTQRSQLARVTDCHAAIDHLPFTGLTPRDFHRTIKPNPANIWELPRSEVFGTCKVNVDLAFVRKERSGWIAIGMAARGLTTYCVYGDRSGGVVHVGADNGIRITVGNVQAIPTLSVGNVTDDDVSSVA